MHKLLERHHRKPLLDLCTLIPAWGTDSHPGPHAVPRWWAGHQHSAAWKADGADCFLSLPLNLIQAGQTCRGEGVWGYLGSNSPSQGSSFCPDIGPKGAFINSNIYRQCITTGLCSFLEHGGVEVLLTFIRFTYRACEESVLCRGEEKKKNY